MKTGEGILFGLLLILAARLIFTRNVLPLLLLSAGVASGQGFGRFATDSPFLAASPVTDLLNDSLTRSNLQYWWISTNITRSPVTNWTDVISGVSWTNQNNPGPYGITNADGSFGMWFNNFWRLDKGVSIPLSGTYYAFGFVMGYTNFGYSGEWKELLVDSANESRGILITENDKKLSILAPPSTTKAVPIPIEKYLTIVIARTNSGPLSGTLAWTNGVAYPVPDVTWWGAGNIDQMGDAADAPTTTPHVGIFQIAIWTNGMTDAQALAFHRQATNRHNFTP